ncbi:MAG: ATP synthase F1 subunit delta [Planctomycetota bacterium]
MPQAVTQTDSVSRVYAKSLFELADEAGKLDVIAGQVESLGELLGESPELRNLLENPAVSSQTRADTINRVFGGRADDLLVKFLLVLNAKDRLATLPGITAAFGHLMDERSGRLPVEVTFANPPSDAELGRVRDQVSASTGKQAQLTVQIDPDIIGGVRLRIGDQLIDATVAARLRRLQHQLSTAGRQHARSA